MAATGALFLYAVGYDSDDGDEVHSCQVKDCKPHREDGTARVDEHLPSGTPESSSIPDLEPEGEHFSRPSSPQSPPNYSGWAPCPVCTYKQRKVPPAEAATAPVISVAPPIIPTGQARLLEARNLYLRQKEKFSEHLRMVRADPELTYLEMTWEEFLSQRPAEEDEFGPHEDLTTIFSDCMELPISKKEQMREWLLRANRYEDVQRAKRQRSEL